MTSRKTLFGEALHELFHENTKNFGLEDEYGGVGGPSHSDESPPEYKRYESGPRVDLDLDDADLPAECSELLTTIRGRRSHPPAEPYALSDEEVAALLDGAAGITRRSDSELYNLRAYPSGGTKYPLETYAVVLNAEDVDRGVYHFDVRGRHLTRISETEFDDLKLADEDALEDAAMVVVLTADFSRTTGKYGERGYRYAHIEAGHLLQNVCLVAETLDLACRPFGGFSEDELDSFLRLGSNETTVYLGIVTKRADAD